MSIVFTIKMHVIYVYIYIYMYYILYVLLCLNVDAYDMCKAYVLMYTQDM